MLSNRVRNSEKTGTMIVIDTVSVTLTVRETVILTEIVIETVTVTGIVAMTEKSTLTLRQRVIVTKAGQ